MRALLCTTALLMAGPALAQVKDFSGTYLCLEEFGGGLFFDELSSGWKATTFRPDARFILQLNLEENRTLESDSLREDYGLYRANVTEMGSDYVDSCRPPGQADATLAPIYSHGILRCNAGLREYKFGLSSLRYIQSYLWGYVDGGDNSSDTPSLMGGTCAKID